MAGGLPAPAELKKRRDEPPETNRRAEMRAHEKLARDNTIDTLKKMAISYSIGMDAATGFKLASLRKRYHTIQKAIDLKTYG